MFLRSILLTAIALTISFILPAQSKTQNFQLQPGDLLFQDLDCGPLCDAIEKVTRGHNRSTFSHVGIVVFNSEQDVKVLEAIGDSVRFTPLAQFLNRTKDAQGKPKVAVGRISPKYKKQVSDYISAASKFRGKPYDAVFAIDNDAYYCSELIYLAYVDKNGKPLFELNPMTYKDPKTQQIFQPWQAYFDSMKVSIPEGEPGINPGGISRSDKLKMFYPYGQPDKLLE